MYMLEERIGRILTELKGYTVWLYHPVEGYKFCKTDETGYESRAYEELDWPLLEDGVWKGRREHYWFVAEVRIPEDLDGKYVVYELETGREGSWDATNPQFEIYVNGRFVQGLDVNHRCVVLSEKASAGETYRISLRAYSGEENPYILLKSRIGFLDTAMITLYYDIAVPYDVAMLLDRDDKNHIEIINRLNETINLLDLRQPMSAAFYESVGNAQAYIDEEFYQKLCGRSEAEVWCVGHTHIDVAWLWTLDVTKEKALRSFSTALELLKEYPEFIFMSSQPQLYQYVKERSPGVFGQIGARVREGRWEAEGGMWLEADCNLASGESLVRQILYGKQFFREQFGVDSRILWMPDVFGYSAAMPQIMRKSGLSYFMTTKLSWNEYNKMPYDTFEWEGIDGTKVLTHFICTAEYKSVPASHFTTYNGMLGASQVMGTWRRYQQKGLNDKVLMCYGYGDGGGGPTAEMLETQRRLARGVPGCPKTVLKTAREYFETLEAETAASRYLPTWTGELYLEFHRGTYTSMARNKRYNRKGEFLLGDVEWISSLDALLNAARYPKEEIDGLWTVLLRNQFHDILPGSSIKEVYEDSKREYEGLFSQAGSLLGDAASALAAEINTAEDSVVVFNPLGFESGDIVGFTVPAGFDSPAVYDIARDGSGTRLACQRTEGGRAIFFAEKVPAKGYKTFAIRNERAEEENELVISPGELSNRYFDIKLNEKGQFASVYDRRAGREVLAAAANVLTVYEDKPHISDNWEVCVYYREKQWTVDDVQSVEVMEAGPVRACLRMTYRFLSSTISQMVYIYKDLARIDVKSDVDWHEKQLLLRASFPVDIHAEEATYEIQFGNVKRPTHFNTSWDFARFEVCAHKWMDLSEDGYGVSLLNDCKYGCDVHDGVMGISLLKSGVYPNPDADKERHEFIYSLYPHEGGWRSAGTVEEAYRLNDPMLALHTPAKVGRLPGDISFVSCDAGSVVVETVKQAEKGDGFIVRMYECRNSRTRATLTFGFEIDSACECDLMENDCEPVLTNGRQFTFEIRPYEIKTFRVIFKNEWRASGTPALSPRAEMSL